jgi:hypothetical protein
LSGRPQNFKTSSTPSIQRMFTHPPNCSCKALPSGRGLEGLIR